MSKKEEATRISRVGRRNTAIYRFADGTTREATDEGKTGPKIRQF